MSAKYYPVLHFLVGCWILIFGATEEFTRINVSVPQNRGSNSINDNIKCRIEVCISSGDQCNVTTSQALPSGVSYRIQYGTLNIELEKDTQCASPVHFDVAMKKVRSLWASLPTDYRTEAADKLATDDLDVNLAGVSSKADLKFQAHSMDIQISGLSNRVKLNLSATRLEARLTGNTNSISFFGTANQAKYIGSGNTNSMSASNLITDDVTVTLTGNKNLIGVTAVKKLVVYVTGNGNKVAYEGNATSTDKQVTGNDNSVVPGRYVPADEDPFNGSGRMVISSLVTYGMLLLVARFLCI